LGHQSGGLEGRGGKVRLLWICPVPSVPLIYDQEAIVPFVVRTRRIRERVYPC